MIAWAAFFVVHSIIAVMGNSREDDIAKEVARLREAAYEKPKRLHLTEDGEIAEDEAWEYDETPAKYKA
jgi:hypothetical protein